MGHRQDVQVAAHDRIGQQLGLVGDHHRAKVELATLEHVELLVDRRRRDDDVEPGRYGQHPPHQLFGTAAHRADAHPHTLQVGRNLETIEVAAQDDQRLRLRQAPDQFEPVAFGIRHAILHQRQVHVTGLACGDQALDVLGGPGRGDVDQLSLAARHLAGEGIDEGVVAAARAAGQHRDLDMAQAGPRVEPGHQGGQQEEACERRAPSSWPVTATRPVRVGRARVSGGLWRSGFGLFCHGREGAVVEGARGATQQLPLPARVILMHRSCRVDATEAGWTLDPVPWLAALAPLAFFVKTRSRVPGGGESALSGAPYALQSRCGRTSLSRGLIDKRRGLECP